ncbi:uncharacterized protein LOC126679724 [Mercurialis annua]|uniref:uncharacterized protein LOC126679724 n=1 Tax=Mercurialis annua TaxID=3986 RepID=UPI00215E3752|nr:uncharacterized protein LOC126679724 [Mercurialis annua]
MSDEGPKLYANKPKKAQIKQFQESAPSTTASASYKMGSQSTAPPPPPPQPPKESFARRYKFIWPLLLSVNLAAGAYLFLRTKKKDPEEEELPNSVPSTPVSATPTTTTASEIEKHNTPPAISEPVKPREPVPENQQRELYKWMLEEKRKLKPKNPEEKKRIDEEKAVLKQFLRAKSVPTV